MKVALVHDWLNGMRGGERVLEVFAEMYPESTIYTLFSDPDKLSGEIKRHRIKTTFIQNLPFRKKHYRHYLPFFPMAIGKLVFDNPDLIISTSHCVAKGADCGERGLHICYCFSPMRYVWDRFDDYFPREKTNAVRYRFISLMAKQLRKWDKASSDRVDLFIADSNFVRRRIETYYGRRAKVIFPPVDTDYYSPGPSSRDGYFLLAGAMVPYKKGEIVIEAFKGLDEKLIVTGEGPEMKRLAESSSKNIEFTGWVDSKTLRDYYRGCRALIFPGVEDFGIVPVEAQLCGRPVIAYGQGGILDTVTGPDIDSRKIYTGFKSGLFFKEQTPQAVREAVVAFSEMEFDSDSIAEKARRFSKDRFILESNLFINMAVDIFRAEGKADIEERMIN